VVRSPDWRFFGLNGQEVIALLKGVSQDGHFLIQSSGELVDVAWKYPSMKECLRAISQG
jgi:hypothetical protein